MSTDPYPTKWIHVFFGSQLVHLNSSLNSFKLYFVQSEQKEAISTLAVVLVVCLFVLFCFVLFCFVLFCFVLFCFFLVWFGLVWFGLVWFGLVWFGLVWFGLVWFGLVWFGWLVGWLVGWLLLPVAGGPSIYSSGVFVDLEFLFIWWNPVVICVFVKRC